MIPHRTTALVSIIVFVALLLLVFSSSSAPEVPTEEDVSIVDKYRPKLPSLSDFNLPYFRPSAHKPPPEQKNSTSGESKWFNDWTWINPFSSSITLDENRSVLPPLRQRPSVYTYYDSDNKKDAEEENADAQLILAWRRAWYAQGFRPVVLGRGEAMRNPYYESVQKIKLDPKTEQDLFRWLAWGHMGTGLLSDMLCFPMARYDDDMLSYLRRGAVGSHITRFDKIRNCLFAGEKPKIDDAISEAIKKVGDKNDDKSTSMLDLVPSEFFKVENPSPLAYYASSSITTHYPSLGENINSTPKAGRLALVELINSHLHYTFQNSFPAGISILKPFPEHTTALVEPSLRLAKALVQCPAISMPASCPPNKPTCQTCGSGKPIRISQPMVYKNTSHLFTIGTLPHPYTLISLQQNSEEVTTSHIRRETERDPWLKEVTKDHLGPLMGGSPRAMVFKQAVGSDTAIGSSLWMTVESLPPEAGQALPSALLDEFEWQFGFMIPRDNKADAKNEGERKESVQDANPSIEGVEKEYNILQKAREILKSKESNRISIKDVAEAWNLADTEVWRFVRAFRFVHRLLTPDIAC